MRALSRPSGRGVYLVAPALGVLMGMMLLAVGANLWHQGGAPSRNVWGNPAYETLLQACTVPRTRTAVRLYRGDAGATVEAWYTVTRQRPGARELQFWFSDRGPVVTAIACGPGGVRLLSEAGTGTLGTFSIDQIENELVPRPLVYFAGHWMRASRDSVQAAGGPAFARQHRALAVPALIVGAVLLAAGGVGLARARRA